MVDALPAVPTLTEPDAWDHVVEVSVYAPTGQLAVHQLEYRFDEHPPQLPPLSQNGPGHYGLRAYARGRHRHFDAVREDSGEEYLLHVWPDQPRPALIVRATDQCGYGLRQAALTQPTNP